MIGGQPVQIRSVVKLVAYTFYYRDLLARHIYNTSGNATDAVANVPEHGNDTNLKNSSLIEAGGRWDLIYIGPLLRDAPAARAASTNIFYGVADHTTALSTPDFRCGLTTSATEQRRSSLRSANS